MEIGRRTTALIFNFPMTKKKGISFSCISSNVILNSKQKYYWTQTSKMYLFLKNVSYNIIIRNNCLLYTQNDIFFQFPTLSVHNNSHYFSYYIKNYINLILNNMFSIVCFQTVLFLKNNVFSQDIYINKYLNNCISFNFYNVLLYKYTILKFVLITIL